MMVTPLKSYDRANRRILIVEGNDLNQRLFKTLLEQHGCETLLAKASEDAIKLAHDALPDLILMNVQLPGGISGLEAARRIRADERTRWIPIIAVTGFRDERAVLAAGCNAYMSIPINVRNFVSTIESFLEERKHQDNGGNDGREENSVVSL
jgi:two-component system cell cycle response regulator DivK